MTISQENFSEAFSLKTEDIIGLGWKEIQENYFSIKRFTDFSKKEGTEWRLSVHPDGIVIEIFSVHYGISGGDNESNYGCNDVFHGKLFRKEDLSRLMKWLSISPLKII